MTSASEQIVALREKTGAGFLDCKTALTEANNDFDKAVEFLRKRGVAVAAKKAGRTASQGLVGSYIHGNGKIGVMVEVNCETDFVARNENFQQFVRDVAMQIAATNPSYVNRSEVPAEVLEREREIGRAQALASGKPEKVIEKIIEGKLDKFFAEVCLLDQTFVKETDKTVENKLTDLVAKIGEKIVIRRFTRYQMGEGLS